MKLKISAKDSMYKIFKLVDKLPKNKKIDIFIDQENEIFDSIWWWKQLVDKLNEKGIVYRFISIWVKSRKYFEVLWIEQVVFQNISIGDKIRWFYNFFFVAKDLHWKILKKRSFLSYLMIVWEILLVLYIFYLFYNLVSPSAKVYVKPSYDVEDIVYNFRYYPSNLDAENQWSRLLWIPYHTGSVTIKQEMSMDVANVRYLQKPARWKIRLINTVPKKFSLVANTKFVTDDWLQFRALEWFNIPEALDGLNEDVVIELEALEQDVDGELIWNRWNIKQGTVLYIKNLKDSSVMKNVYWVAEDQFKWWDTTSEWVVSLTDIDMLKNNLVQHITKDKKQLLLEQIDQNNNVVLLNFDDFIKAQIKSVNVNANPWDQISRIEWVADVIIDYLYINREDIKAWFQKYIEQRASDSTRLIDIDQGSLLFYDKEQEWDYIIIPTKIDIVRWYDFENDVNWIKNELKSKLLWKNILDTQDIVLRYKEIDAVTIRITPEWYDILPSLKSRIDIMVAE